MDEDLYSPTFDIATGSTGGPLTFSSDFSRDDIIGIREYAALNPQDEDAADSDLGRVLDILKDPATEARLFNLASLPISLTAGEISERIVNQGLVRDLDLIRNTAPPAPAKYRPDEIFDDQEIAFLNRTDNVQFSALVEDLPLQPATRLQRRPGTPVAFSDLSSSSQSMSTIDGGTSGDAPSRPDTPLSNASSGLLIHDLLDVDPHGEEMAIDRSQEIKGKMSAKSTNKPHETGANPSDQFPPAQLDDEIVKDENKEDSLSDSSYYEERDLSKPPPGKKISAVDSMSALALEVEEANSLLEKSLYSTPDQVFQLMDKQTASELGVTPLLYSGMAYLSKASNRHMGHIQALNVAVTEVSKVVSRTEDKMDMLGGEVSRLCSEIGGLTAEVKKNTLGISLLQSTLEKLLINGFPPRRDPPPPPASVTIRPPDNPPTATVSIAKTITYEQYKSMGMAERLKYRKSGGVVPCPPGQSTKSTFTAEGALPLQSQPLVSFEPLEKPPTAEQVTEVVKLTDSDESKSRQPEFKKKMRKRTNAWKSFTQLGMSEQFLKLTKDQVLSTELIRKYQEQVATFPDKDKEKLTALKATIFEMAKTNPNLLEMKELLRRVTTKDEFLLYLNAMASIHEGIQEFE
ncbi:ORF2 [Bemisia tabaci arlivirus 1]|uniref:ORF2 n=1 Tax=Bemisia tabaci arlivirus 1 TaxID=2840017 RepID=A0A8E8FTK3_9MONO|nr:ORF2 [Bemisia tabaci arlivirus 1]QWC36456.1 ORF2 [Bemisia tabaci arlivirus 1]